MSDMDTYPQNPMSEFHRMVAEALDDAGAPPGPTVLHRIASLGEQRDKAQAKSRLLEGVEAEIDKALAPLYRQFQTNDLAVVADEALRLRRAAKTDVVADPLRVQATPAEGFGIAIEWTLDTVEAPRAPTISDRITALAGQRDELRAHLDAIKKALNVGPASDSDVKPGTDPKRIVDIVRTRTEMLLDERSRRVALAEEVQALERQIMQERQQAINRLLLWMSGERCEIASELLDQVARAVEAGIVTADDANDARRSRRELATLVLNVDFGKPRTDDIPF